MSKILFPLLTYYPSNIGGQASTLFWHVKNLARQQGIQTTVITTFFGISSPNNLKANVLNDYGYGLTNYVQTKHPKYSILYVVSTLKLIKGVDIIQLSGLFFPPTLLILLSGLLRRKKVIISARGELFNSAISRKSILKSIYLWPFKLLSKKIFWHATSESEKEIISSYFKSPNCILIPNYIERNEKIVCQKKKQILFLGRINPIKGLDIFIESLAESKVFMNSNYKFIIAGKAGLTYEIEFKNKLEMLIGSLNLHNKITFVGEVKDIEKEVILAESHCLVLPSHSENFGNVVLESLNQGTPVMASTGTPWQELETEKCGWWIENSISQMSLAIDKIINQDSIEYKRYSSNAIKLISAKYDIKKNIDKWSDLYKSLVV